MAQADQAHRRAQERLGDALSRALAAILAGLPQPETQEAMEHYSREAVRLVGGGQHRSASLAIAYVARSSPPARGRLPASVDRALEGVAVTAESPVASSPMLRLWGRLAEGDDVATARAAAASYAGGLATGDLQAAERGGLDEGVRVGGRPVRGWRKVLSSDPCPWCRTVASSSGRYHSADSVPFHQRDRCGVAPVFEE